MFKNSCKALIYRLDGLEIFPSTGVPKKRCPALIVAGPSIPSTFKLALPYLFKKRCHALITVLTGLLITPSTGVPQNCCHLRIVLSPRFPYTTHFSTTLPLPSLKFFTSLSGLRVAVSMLLVHPKDGLVFLRTS